MGDAEGDHRPRPQHHEDQDHRSPREEVLCLDRRIHPGFPLHLPADVDLQAGVRRVWPIHRAQEMLLNYLVFFYRISIDKLPQCISTCRGYMYLNYNVIVPAGLQLSYPTY